MKKILILILGLTLASGAVFADEEKAKPGGGDRMQKMQENLGLSDQQVAEIRRIRDAGGSKEEILAVLTPEQIAIMKERRAQMKGKGRKGKRRPPPEDAQKSTNAET